ncbi:MAG: secretion system protein [Chloroflexota bacterium]
MELIPIISGLLTGLAVALAAYYVLNRRTARRRATAERIRRDFGSTADLPSILRFDRPGPVLMPLSKVARERLAAQLEQAGWRLRPEEFAALRLGATLVGGLLGILVAERLGLWGIQLLVGALPGGLMGWVLPGWYLARSRQRRLQKIEQQLPDALMAMAKSMRAGLGILQAVNYVAQETPPPLGTEFQNLLRDLQLGIEAEEAFATMARRVGSEDLNIAVTAIIIQRTIGGGLAEILTNVTNTIRERARLQGEIRALTARHRLQANLSALIPVAVALAFIALNPRLGDLLINTTEGRISMAVGIFFELLGIWLTRRLATIEV